jgi:hypothetical protein
MLFHDTRKSSYFAYISMSISSNVDLSDLSKRKDGYRDIRYWELTRTNIKSDSRTQLGPQTAKGYCLGSWTMENEISTRNQYVSGDL